MLKPAIERLKDAESVKTRFTRFKLEHNVVFDGTAKKVADTHKLFEDTWINDLPYSRLVEVEGKLLEGKALADEQARFDKAVAERKAIAGSPHRSRGSL